MIYDNSNYVNLEKIILLSILSDDSGTHKHNSSYWSTGRCIEFKIWNRELFPHQSNATLISNLFVAY
jgi:hypothetical protein